MKKSIIIILAVVAILVIWAVSVYNGLVTMDENVSGQWANVETQYQRRADLIPNLVNTVKGYASHEKETLEGVVEARSKATQIKVDAEGLTPEKLAEYQKAQGAVTSALGKLFGFCFPSPGYQYLSATISALVSSHGCNSGLPRRIPSILGSKILSLSAFNPKYGLNRSTGYSISLTANLVLFSINIFQ